MTMNPLTPSIRCVLLVGTAPGLEARPVKSLLTAGLIHHSTGFSMVATDPDDQKALAAALRELADALEAPTVPDPDLV